MAQKIALIASGITSPLFGMLAFADRLRSAGFDVLFLAPQIAHDRIAFAGFERTSIPEPVVWSYGPLLPKASKGETRRERGLKAVDALGVDDLEASIRAVAPNLIVVDCEMHAHILLALSLDIPVVQSNNMYLTPPSLRAPPLHKAAIPGRGVLGSPLGTGFLWAQHLAQKAASILKRKRRFKGADYPSALIKLANRLGVNLSKLRRFMCWQYPWTYRIPTLIFLPQALDLPTRPYETMTYLGPMIWKKRPAIETNNDLITRFCDPTSGKKRIYAAFGSMLTPESEFIAKLWAAVARHPEWQLLCVVGDHWSEQPDRKAPDNVDVIAWAPQLEVLASADLAIFHGGAGTMVEAVDTATPMLVYPYVLDEFGNGARVAFHGLGRMGKKRDTSQKIEADIEHILNDASILRACQTMKTACRVEQDNRIAETLIGDILGAP